MNAHHLAQAERAHFDRQLAAYEAQVDADEAFEEELDLTIAEIYADAAYIAELTAEITGDPEYDATIADYVAAGRQAAADRHLANAIDARVTVRAFELIRVRQEKAKADYEAERAMDRFGS